MHAVHFSYVYNSFEFVIASAVCAEFTYFYSHINMYFDTKLCNSFEIRCFADLGRLNEAMRSEVMRYGLFQAYWMLTLYFLLFKIDFDSDFLFVMQYYSSVLFVNFIGSSHCYPAIVQVSVQCSCY